MKTDKHFLFFSKNISDNSILLDRDETAHLAGVLRFSEGDVIQITDGMGNVFESKIEKMKKDSTLCEILYKKYEEHIKIEITVAVGMPDKDKFEQICEYANPMGVKKIVPLITDRCDKKLFDARFDKIRERCDRKIIASVKQSLNPYITVVENPVKLDDFVNNMEKSVDSMNLLADFDGKLMADVFNVNKLPKKLCLFVGPPAGFSGNEVDFLSDLCDKVYLGKYRLRTELAVVSAVGQITSNLR